MHRELGQQCLNLTSWSFAAPWPTKIHSISFESHDEGVIVSSLVASLESFLRFVMLVQSYPIQMILIYCCCNKVANQYRGSSINIWTLFKSWRLQKCPDRYIWFCSLLLIDSNGNHVSGQWGRCKSDCPSKLIHTSID